MRFSISKTAAVVALAALTAMTAAGCSSSSKSPAAGAPASGAAQGAATTAAAGSGSGSGSSQGGSSADIDACKLLSAAQASSIGGETYTSAATSTIAPGQDQCAYATSDDSNALTIIVYQPNSGVTFQTMSSVQAGVGTVTNVSGVGDKAIAGAIELDVQAGSHLIAVEGADGMITGDDSKSIALAKAVITALG